METNKCRPVLHAHLDVATERPTKRAWKRTNATPCCTLTWTSRPNARRRGHGNEQMPPRVAHSLGRRDRTPDEEGMETNKCHPVLHTHLDVATERPTKRTWKRTNATPCCTLTWTSRPNARRRGHGN